MKTRRFVLLLTLLFLTPVTRLKARHPFYADAAPTERLHHFWYCSKNLISDQGSAAICQGLTRVEKGAARLHDEQLRKYATYFGSCLRILYSKNYEQHIATGNYESVANVYRKGQAGPNKRALQVLMP